MTVEREVERKPQEPDSPANQRDARNATTEPDELVQQAFDAIIEDIRTRWGTSQVSKQERLLEVFRDQPQHEADLAELAPIFAGNSTDPERLAQKKISELNAKLEDFGLQIKRSPVYRVTHLREQS